MKKSAVDRGLKQWNRLVKQQKRMMRQIRRTRRQFARTFNKKTLTPKPIRRFQSIRKIAKSVRKNSNAYLTGVYAVAHTVGNFFRVP